MCSAVGRTRVGRCLPGVEASVGVGYGADPEADAGWRWAAYFIGKSASTSCRFPLGRLASVAVGTTSANERPWHDVDGERLADATGLVTAA